MSEINNLPYVIVLGNEKGGTGKSTVSMHVIVHLLRLGYSVGSMDIDARQGTLSRYIQNRQKYIDKNKAELPMSVHCSVHKSNNDSTKAAETEDIATFEEAFTKLAHCDFVVIDTPGNDTFLSRLAHSFADTLITPINDSFVDLDVLVKVDDIDLGKITPSHYAETVWQQKKRRLSRDKISMDWIVLRNRMSAIGAKNKEDMWDALQLLSKRISFRLGTGLTERVIFRELFLTGLTLLDLGDINVKMTLSHIAAKQELRNLLLMLNIPDLHERLDRLAS